MDITKTPKAYKNLMMNYVMIPLSLIISLFFTIAKSEEIIVGGAENRWTDGFGYSKWAEGYHFTVGDVLVFQYSTTAHNLYDVNRETFRSCNTSTGVNEKYDSGDDHVELKEAKQYWFICTVDQHCQLGMKLEINVSKAITTNYSVDSPMNNNNNNNNTPMIQITRGFYYILAIGVLSILITIV